MPSDRDGKRLGVATLLECETADINVPVCSLRDELNEALQHSPDYQNTELDSSCMMTRYGPLFELNARYRHRVTPHGGQQPRSLARPVWLLVHAPGHVEKFAATHWLKLTAFLNKHTWCLHYFERLANKLEQLALADARTSGPLEARAFDEGCDVCDLVLEHVRASEQGFENTLNDLGTGLSDSNSDDSFLVRLLAQLRFESRSTAKRCEELRTRYSKRLMISCELTGQHSRTPNEQPGRPEDKKDHVFLSYCRDNAESVAQLRSNLLAAGEQVWWDQDILGGQDWKHEIQTAMQQAYAVVVCFSQETARRQKSGIFPELLDAIDAYRAYAPGSIFLIPIRLSECSIPNVEISATQNLNRLQLRRWT